MYFECSIYHISFWWFELYNIPHNGCVVTQVYWISYIGFTAKFVLHLHHSFFILGFYSGERIDTKHISRYKLYCDEMLQKIYWIILLTLSLPGFVTWHSYMGWFRPVGLRQKCLFPLVWSVSKCAFIFKMWVHFQNVGMGTIFYIT